MGADFMLVCEEFPRFKEGWRWEALRREARRCQMFKKHKRAITYRHLAAKRIQEGFKKHLKLKKNGEYSKCPPEPQHAPAGKMYLADMVTGVKLSYAVEEHDDASLLLGSRSTLRFGKDTPTSDELKAYEDRAIQRHESLTKLIHDMNHKLHELRGSVAHVSGNPGNCTKGGLEEAFS